MNPSTLSLRRSLSRAVATLVLAASSLSSLACSVGDSGYDRPEGRAIKDPREVPPSPNRTTPETVKVSLVAREMIAEIGPDTTFPVWTFNGTVPGPMIRVIEGDTVEVTLTNELRSKDPHSIDLHAAIGPGGGGPVSQVAPGETRTFSFKATRQGAFIYHCAAEGMPWEHIAHGMFGMIQVDPPGGAAPGYRELYVGQNEWYLGDPADAHEEEEEMEHGESGDDGRPRPRFVLDTDKAQKELPDLFTFNGHTEALTEPKLYGDAMSVTQGEKVRIFFVNGGPNKISSLHVVGQIFSSAYTSHPADRTRNEETLLVAPGSAAVVELEALVPGSYALVDHSLYRAEKGAMGLLHVAPQAEPSAEDPDGSWPTDLFSPPSYGRTGH